MTPARQKALDFIRERIVRAGFAPTHREVAEHLGTSTGGAYYVIDGLVAEGLLERRAGAARGLRLPYTPDLRTVDSALLRAELERRGEVVGALSRPERRAFGRGSVACAASCCDIQVRRGHAFCYDHWIRISPQSQAALLQANRVASMTRDPDDAQRYQDAFTQAKDEAEGAGWPVLRELLQ